MARGAAKGADNGVRAKLLAGIAHAAGAVFQMHPVEPVAQRQLHMVVDDHGHVAGMGDLARQIGDAAQLVLGSRAGDAQAGDRKAVHHLGPQRPNGRGRRPDRGDQIKLRRIGLVCHGAVILVLDQQIAQHRAPCQ